MKPFPTDPDDTERAVRRVLRKNAVKLRRVLLSPACHRFIENSIRGQIAILQWLKGEAKRKRQGKPLSKEYQKLCQLLVTGATTAKLGPLSSLNPEQVSVLDQMLGALLDGLCGRDAIPGSLDPAAFLSFQKKFFFPAKKRGPKNRPDYDVAFTRHLNGEEVSSIARDMEPDAYERDPVNTLQRYCNALKRRQGFRRKAR